MFLFAWSGNWLINSYHNIFYQSHLLNNHHMKIGSTHLYFFNFLFFGIVIIIVEFFPVHHSTFRHFDLCALAVIRRLLFFFVMKVARSQGEMATQGWGYKRKLNNTSHKKDIYYNYLWTKRLRMVRKHNAEKEWVNRTTLSPPTGNLWLLGGEKQSMVKCLDEDSSPHFANSPRCARPIHHYTP